MNDIQIFNSPEFGSVRTVDIDGKIYFMANDVAKALGYSDCPKAIRTHCKGVAEIATPTAGGIQSAKFIPEGDIYRLIIKSQLPAAEKFEKWVFDDVLPTIRKTGSYNQPQLPQTTDGKIALLAQGHVELKAEIDSVKADLEQFKNDMPILGVEESKITAAVKKKGVECLGGKNSNAYNDKSLRQKLYSDLHRQLKREFGVSTYKAIKRNQTESAVLIIQGYKPPLVLSDTITYKNAQQTLEV